MRILIACAFSMLPVLAAQAAEKPGPLLAPGPGGHGPCAADIARFCKDVPIGNGRRIACLDAHKAQLGAACRERVPKMQALFEYGKRQHAKTEAAADKQINPPKPVAKPSPPKQNH